MIVSIPFKYSPEIAIKKYLQNRRKSNIKCISYIIEQLGKFAEFTTFFFQNEYGEEIKVLAVITRSSILFEEMGTIY